MNSSNIAAWLDIEAISRWVFVLILALVITMLTKVVLRAVAGRLKRIARHTKAYWDDLVFEALGSTKSWLIFVWALYLLFPLLDAHSSVRHAIYVAVVILTSFQVVIWGLQSITHWKKNYLVDKVSTDPSSIAAIGLLATIIQAFVIVIVLLIGLSNLGVDVFALVAGLGVGGIAVALAAQNVLGDILASLSIVLDKPFVVGDAITVGNQGGTVEDIGLKTTRLRSFSGEELIFSNKDLLESRIQNFKRMWERRVVHKIGVTYATPIAKLEEIPKWIKQFVEREPKLKFDRCHLLSYGSSSLDFELVFYVKDPDYNTYMDIQQRLLLDVLKKFEAEDIELAYPTQTLLIEKVPAAVRAVAEAGIEAQKPRDLPAERRDGRSMGRTSERPMGQSV